MHRLAGRLYVVAMIGVLSTAAIMAALLILTPLEIRVVEGDVPPETRRHLEEQVRVIGVFFSLLVLVTLTAGRNGLVAIRKWRGQTLARDRSGLLLNAACLAAGPPAFYLGLAFAQPLLAMFAMISALLGGGWLWQARQPATSRDAWLGGHFSGMITTGIAAHTAFLSFGVVRFVPDFYTLSPSLYVIPWVMPAVAGSIAIALLRRHYGRKPVPSDRNRAALGHKAGSSAGSQ